MRLGLYPVRHRTAGGIFQYAQIVRCALREWFTSPSALDEAPGAKKLPSARDWSLVLFTHHAADDEDDAWIGRGGRADSGGPVEARPVRPPWASEPSIDLTTIPKPGRRLRQADMEAWFRECGVDLMIYPYPHRLAVETDLPFVMAVHDLQHRLQPRFREVAGPEERRAREYVLRHACREAQALLVDSETGREDLVDAFGARGLDEGRVEVLPYPAYTSLFPAPAMEEVDCVLGRFGLSRGFGFYPAQFWPHKNHVRLVEAWGRLWINQGVRVPLALCGSAKGPEAEAVVRQVEGRRAGLGLDDAIRLLGYVRDEELRCLYRAASVLVMPTFFGPTNIPVLEAWEAGCPVVTSDIRGIREQVGDAGILVDPEDSASIAEGVGGVLTDRVLREDLVHRGRIRLEQASFPCFVSKLAGVLRRVADGLAVTQRGGAVTVGR